VAVELEFEDDAMTVEFEFDRLTASPSDASSSEEKHWNEFYEYTN
jgi:hypothetical protein